MPSSPSAAVPLGDFFASRGWTITRDGLIAFGVVFWLAIGFWTFKDARRRIRSPWLVALATLVGLVPPYLGALVYMLFRPPEYLDEVRERELEIRAIEERLAAGNAECPVCTTRLRDACPACKAPLEPLWQVCPFCETPVVRRPAMDMVEALGSTMISQPVERPQARRRTPRKPSSK